MGRLWARVKAVDALVVMTKLHARDRAQLAVIAYESGPVTPGGN